MTRPMIAFGILGAWWLAIVPGGAADAPPATVRKSVKDTYHGVEVADDYRWLESWDDPAVKAWSEGQNAYARSVLDHLPGVPELRERITKLVANAPSYSRLQRRGGTLLALKYDPPRQQPFLVSLHDPDAPAGVRVIVDPNAIDAKGGTSIDWYAASADGAKVAVSLAEGGSERGNLHVYETATGRKLADVVPRVNYGTALGSVCWAPDGLGFYYTRYPREGERPPADMDFYVQVYFHALGTPTGQDRYEIGKDFPRIAEIGLECGQGGLVLANVANGDGGEFAQYLRGRDGHWAQLTRFADQVVDAVFGPGPSLYLFSRHDAPRGQVLRLALADAGPPEMSRARVVVPQAEDAAVDFRVIGGAPRLVTTDSRLYVMESAGGPSRVRIFDPDGRPQGTLPAPDVSSVYEIVPFEGETLLFGAVRYVEPLAWYRYEPDGPRAPARLALSSTSPADFSDVEVVRETATSMDGTRVPMTILRRRGTTLDGGNPALLTGYGGFGYSLAPFFDPTLRVWLDAGGVFAVANVHGGGEFGDDWHRAGNLLRKQNVFDDFVASAERLVALGYTRPARLAIQGGSNGGLLMGAALTQRPDLFQAVVSHVGIYDMLRVERSPNGAFNVPEFGTVKNADQFRAMHAYSPYHHVKDGVRYPAVLFLTGANDPRVDPMHSRKMTARLQAATTRGRGTVLLRTSAGSGHGIGTALAEVIEQGVDVYAFLFAQLGMRYSPPTP